MTVLGPGAGVAGSRPVVDEDGPFLASKLVEAGMSHRTKEDQEADRKQTGFSTERGVVCVALTDRLAGTKRNCLESKEGKLETA
jgi:hypothetical protein